MAVITRLFEDYAQARRAVDAVNALGRSGVDASILGNETIRDRHDTYERDYGTRSDIVVDEAASGAATGAGVGAAVGGGAGLLAGLGMLAIPGLGPIVAAGWLAATAVGAAGGALAGGAIGALADLGISEEDAPVYSEALRRGGVMVSVRAADADRPAVEQALSSVTPHDVTTLRSRYESEGWRAGETDAEREARLRDTPPPPPFQPMI